MAERNWGLITNGATFESLATRIVFFEDSNARLFGRRGKDGGQDARSGDGKRVFQAKHHENASAAAAIRDAKEEAKKIEKYRHPEHERYGQWKDITSWRLITNAAFNPADDERWKKEVVPLFRTLGLDADYWERANLDALLDKHPDLHHSFFEKQIRVFLSIPEAISRLLEQPTFLRRGEKLAPFCGREAEIERVREFLGSPNSRFLLVHGAGGMGKTRLLIEAGEGIAGEGAWQVLWANVASMGANSTWFEGVRVERPTLLLLDEPDDPKILRILNEQCAGRLSSWKIAVAVRSPKDPVLRFLRGPQMKRQKQELLLEALPLTDAEAMCRQLLATGALSNWPEEKRERAVRRLSKQFDRHPIWLALAVQHLEQHGSLEKIPSDAKELADEYLREIEEGQADIEQTVVRNLLRWVALIGTVNREDDTTIQLIGERTGAGTLVQTRQKLASLIDRRALNERGAYNRLIELKPDVLRDHVLLRWLFAEVGGREGIAPYDDADELIQTVANDSLHGKLDHLGRAILSSLARSEFLLRLSGHRVDLLGKFFKTLKESLPKSANQRLPLLGVLEIVASFRPRDVEELIRMMRKDPSPDETVEGLLGPKQLGQADVILALGWPLIVAATGAEAEDRASVFDEMCEVAKAEAEIAPTLPYGLPNDGRRAGRLVTRALQGGPNFRSDYNDVAKDVCVKLLNSLMKSPPTRGEVALLEALLQPMLSLERQQDWSDERTITWRTLKIRSESRAGRAREEVLDLLKTALTVDKTPTDSRVQLWHVYAKAREGAAAERLAWTYEILATKEASLAELVAAREVWAWHIRYEKDEQLRAAAEKLETIYRKNEIARELEPLTRWDDFNEQDRRNSEKARQLASECAGEIADFIDRAVSFLGGEDKLERVRGVAWYLGNHAESSDSVQDFVALFLRESAVTPRSRFAISTAVRWVGSVRKNEPNRAHLLVGKLLEQCGSDEQRAALLQQLYARIPPSIENPSREEIALLRDAGEVFRKAGREVDFIAALALTLDHDWAVLRPQLEETLRAVPAESLTFALSALIGGVYWITREAAAPRLPSDLVEWLMSQLLLLPDFGDLADLRKWELSEILKRLGKVDVRWLARALAEAAAESGKRPVTYSGRISEYVQKITESDLEDDSVREALDELFVLVENEGWIGHYLPDVIRDVDPEGLFFPQAVAAKAPVANSPEYLRKLARIGKAYALNGASWRTIAKAVLHATAPHGSEARQRLFDTLSDRHTPVWSAPFGEVAQVFIRAVDDAQAALEAEADPDFRPFWEYRLRIAELELRAEEERVKEDRGE